VIAGFLVAVGRYALGTRRLSRTGNGPAGLTLDVIKRIRRRPKHLSTDEVKDAVRSTRSGQSQLVVVAACAARYSEPDILLPKHSLLDCDHYALKPSNGTLDYARESSTAQRVRLHQRRSTGCTTVLPACSMPAMARFLVKYSTTTAS